MYMIHMILYVCVRVRVRCVLCIIFCIKVCHNVELFTLWSHAPRLEVNCVASA